MAHQSTTLPEKTNLSPPTVINLNPKSFVTASSSPSHRSPQVSSPTYPLPPPNSPSSPQSLATSNLSTLGIHTHDALDSLGCGSAPDRFLPSRFREKGDMNPFVAGGGSWKRPGVSRGSSYSSVRSWGSGSGKSEGGYGRKKEKEENGNREKGKGKGNEEGVTGDLWEYGH